MVFVVVFFRFSRCMVAFLKNHLNLQNLFIWTNTNMISASYQKLWIPKKNLCEHVRSCIVLEEKGNTPKDFWRNGFMPKGYAQCVICMKLQQKGKACHEHQKTHDLINKKGYIWQGKSCGILSQITNKNWNRLKQKSRSFAGMIKQR